MYFDCHCHIFTQRIIENVGAKTEMVRELQLDVAEAAVNFRPRDLEAAAVSCDVSGCVILPSALPDKVTQENDRCFQISRKHDLLLTFATLHPNMSGLEKEIQRSFDRGIRGFKFSSFSQRFSIESPEMASTMKAVEKAGIRNGLTPVVILDTFCKADKGFGADPDHLTTPSRLSRIYPAYPGINFIGAHMGGLTAKFDDLEKYLTPAPNFYLDTSNAAHTLRESEFIGMLRIHGASHVLFGTDWPWFRHSQEIPLIRSILLKANLSRGDCSDVFQNNALKLLGIRDAL